MEEVYKALSNEAKRIIESCSIVALLKPIRVGIDLSGGSDTSVKTYYDITPEGTIVAYTDK